MSAPGMRDLQMTGFRDFFKYYKRRVPPPDLHNVIDFDKPDLGKVIRVVRRDDGFDGEQLGLRAPDTWKIWEFVEIPGLMFIENPFTAKGQCWWITKCLKDYSKEPSKLNLAPHNFLGDGETWWDVCTGYRSYIIRNFRDSERSKELVPKLRWATLGYHHNWDTKRYSEDSRDDVPTELSKMTGVLARIAGFDDFKAEAAIVNYYRMNSTLAGHTDHSEVDLHAPLFSISFGQSAIFLIGGSTQDEPANALILRSGDVVAMTGESRLRYHGVPRILPADDIRWNLDDENDKSCWELNLEDWRKARSFISEARININVRQVLRHGQTAL